MINDDIKMPPYLNAAYEGDDLFTGDQLRATVLAEAVSLRDQNSELDRRLAEMEQAGRQALEALGLVVWTNNPPVTDAIAALRQALGDKP